MSCKVLVSREESDIRPWRVRPLEGPAADIPRILPPEFEERRETERARSELAQKDLEQKLAASFQLGAEEGRRQSAVEAEAALQPMVQRLSHSVQALASLRPKMRAESEQELLTLVMAVARRVLHREITLDPNSIVTLLRVALERLTRSELTTVKVHPDMVSRIREQLTEEGYTEVNVEADVELQLGDLLFGTERGTLDATIDTQLAEIGRGLADRL